MRGNGLKPHIFPRWIFPSHKRSCFHFSVDWWRSCFGWVSPPRKTTKSGEPAKGTRRFPTVASARRHGGVHRSTCRGSPQKNRRGSRGLSSQGHCWTCQILWHQNHLLRRKKNTEIWWAVVFPPYCRHDGSVGQRPHGERRFFEKASCWLEAGWERVLPISNFRGRKRQLQERVHEALAANSCGNDASFNHILI